MDGFVPVSRPHIWGDEKLNLCQAIDGGWISSRGPFLDEFENRFAEKIGARYAVAVSSGMPPAPRELFGDAAKVRADLGLGVAAERRTERAVRDFLGEQPRRAADHPLPPLAFSHTNPQEACRRERTC
jgi:hypothetical protein